MKYTHLLTSNKTAHSRKLKLLIETLRKLYLCLINKSSVLATSIDTIKILKVLSNNLPF